MTCLSKKFVLILLFTLVVSGVLLLLVEPVVAPVTMPSNPKAAPEIVSVEIHHNPVWCPPVYTTNPYTGEITLTSPGYWRPFGTIEITIKNQPLQHILTKTVTISTYITLFSHVSPILGYLGIL